MNEIAEASVGCVDEARALEKRIWEQHIKPRIRRMEAWLWKTTKRGFSSSHRGRWDDDRLND